MRLISAYLRLYRLDAALISFSTYLVGAELAGGARPRDVLAAFLISGISNNFCYSFNSWADWRTDAVNKPWRPIPSGRVPPRAALAYSMVLLALALVYPFFLPARGFPLACFLALPVLGVLYSAKPFSFKFRGPLSVMTVSAGLTIPIVASYYLNTGEGRVDLRGFFAAVFVYCLVLIPLKDIEDVRGDGQWNLYKKYGGRLTSFALGGLLADALLITALDVPNLLRAGLSVLFAASALCIVWHRAHPEQLDHLYQRVIRIVEASGAVFYGWLFLFNHGVVGARLF